MRKWRVFAAALALTLAAGASAQQSVIGGQTSRPRLQTVTATQAGTTASPTVKLTSSLPLLQFEETDGAANNKRWNLLANGEQLALSAINDAGTGTTILTVDRTALTIDSIGLNGPAQLTQVGTTAIPTAKLTNTLPLLQFDETDAAANNRRWNLLTNGEQLSLGVVDDAGSGSGAITIDRTGITVDSINLLATSVQTNGVDITGSTTSATGTVTGCTTAPTATFRYTRNGNMVVMHIDSTSAACTSNATTFTFTNAVPVGFRPARQHECVLAAANNGTGEFAIGLISNSSTFTLARLLTGSSGWTNSGTKSVDVGATCHYLMQ